MNHELKTQIVAALEDFLKRHNMSANEFAKKSDVNASYISNLRNGNFTVTAGDNEVLINTKYFEMIADYIGYEIDKSYWTLVPTDQFARIMATLEDGRRFGYTNTIIAESGSGKSYAALVFAKKYPRDCYIITVGNTDTVKDVVDKVEESVLGNSPLNKSTKIREIIKYMRQQKMNGLSPMIIFDEAENLNQHGLAAIKEFYDNLVGVCAIVLIGTDQLIQKLDKMRKRNKVGMPQLYRRIKFGIRILQPIDRTFKHFLNTIGITEPSVVRFLRDNCTNYGELHDVLVPALREAERTGSPLTENFIRTIFNMPKLG